VNASEQLSTDLAGSEAVSLVSADWFVDGVDGSEDGADCGLFFLIFGRFGRVIVNWAEMLIEAKAIIPITATDGIMIFFIVFSCTPRFYSALAGRFRYPQGVAVSLSYRDKTKQRKHFTSLGAKT